MTVKCIKPISNDKNNKNFKLKHTLLLADFFLIGLLIIRAKKDITQKPKQHKEEGL